MQPQSYNSDVPHTPVSHVQYKQQPKIQFPLLTTYPRDVVTQQRVSTEEEDEAEYLWAKALDNAIFNYPTYLSSSSSLSVSKHHPIYLFKNNQVTYYNNLGILVMSFQQHNTCVLEYAIEQMELDTTFPPRPTVVESATAKAYQFIKKEISFALKNDLFVNTKLIWERFVESALGNIEIDLHVFEAMAREFTFNDIDQRLVINPSSDGGYLQIPKSPHGRAAAALDIDPLSHPPVLEDAVKEVVIKPPSLPPDKNNTPSNQILNDQDSGSGINEHPSLKQADIACIDIQKFTSLTYNRASLKKDIHQNQNINQNQSELELDDEATVRAFPNIKLLPHPPGLDVAEEFPIKPPSHPPDPDKKKGVIIVFDAAVKEVVIKPPSLPPDKNNTPSNQILNDQDSGSGINEHPSLKQADIACIDIQKFTSLTYNRASLKKDIHQNQNINQNQSELELDNKVTVSAFPNNKPLPHPPGLDAAAEEFTMEPPSKKGGIIVKVTPSPFDKSYDTLSSPQQPVLDKDFRIGNIELRVLVYMDQLLNLCTLTYIFPSHLHIVPRTKRFNFCPVVQNAPYGITSSYNDYQAKNQNLTFHGQPVAASETTIKPLSQSADTLTPSLNGNTFFDNGYKQIHNSPGQAQGNCLVPSLFIAFSSPNTIPFRSCDQNNGFSIMKSSSHPPASDVAEEIFITPPSLEFQHQMFWQSYANRFKEKRGGSYLPCYTHSHRIIDEWRI